MQDTRHIFSLIPGNRLIRCEVTAKSTPGTVSESVTDCRELRFQSLTENLLVVNISLDCQERRHRETVKYLDSMGMIITVTAIVVEFRTCIRENIYENGVLESL